jgi:hypothetical protein
MVYVINLDLSLENHIPETFADAAGKLGVIPLSLGSI